MVFLPNLGVNLRTCLCGVVNYASAQALDFLDLGQKSAFLDWKHHKVPIFGKGLIGMGSRLNLYIYSFGDYNLTNWIIVEDWKDVPFPKAGLKDLSLTEIDP